MADRGYLKADSTAGAPSFPEHISAGVLGPYQSSITGINTAGVLRAEEVQEVGPAADDELARASLAVPFASQHTRSSSAEELQRRIEYLEGTVAHLRGWLEQLTNRYHLLNPDASRPVRRVYVGNLHPSTNENSLRTFLNTVMLQCGASVSPGLPILSCKLYLASPAVGGSLPPNPIVSSKAERAYAFVELRTAEEASNMMALDGLVYQGIALKVRRPNNYDPNLAIAVGPLDPNPAMDLSQLKIVRTLVQDSPNKIFIGGLPSEWVEDQVQELLLHFGKLRAFNLVKDRNTGNSKGYAFCEYEDPGVTDFVIQALNGKPVGNKFLTVKRALGPQTATMLV